MSRMRRFVVTAMLALTLLGSAWAQEAEPPSVGASIGRTALEFAAGGVGMIIPTAIAAFASGAEIPFLAAAPAASGASIALVGRALDPLGTYGSAIVGAYLGTVGGALVGAGVNRLAQGDYSNDVFSYYVVILGMIVMTPTGGVVGYKLSRSRPLYNSGRFRLDPPTLAFVLAPSPDSRTPRFDGLKAGVNLRF